MTVKFFVGLPSDVITQVNAYRQTDEIIGADFYVEDGIIKLAVLTSNTPGAFQVFPVTISLKDETAQEADAFDQYVYSADHNGALEVVNREMYWSKDSELRSLSVHHWSQFPSQPKEGPYFRQSEGGILSIHGLESYPEQGPYRVNVQTWGSEYNATFDTKTELLAAFPRSINGYQYNYNLTFRMPGWDGSYLMRQTGDDYNPLPLPVEAHANYLATGPGYLTPHATYFKGFDYASGGGSAPVYIVGDYEEVNRQLEKVNLDENRIYSFQLLNSLESWGGDARFVLRISENSQDT